jgi:ribosomal protein L27
MAHKKAGGSTRNGRLFAKAHGVVEFRVKGAEQHTYVNVVTK